MKRTLIVDQHDRPVGVVTFKDSYHFHPLQQGRNTRKNGSTLEQCLPWYVNQSLMRRIPMKAGQSVKQAIASYTLDDAVEAMHASSASITTILTAYHKKYGLGHFSVD